MDDLSNTDDPNPINIVDTSDSEMNEIDEVSEELLLTPENEINSETAPQLDGVIIVEPELDIGEQPEPDMQDRDPIILEDEDFETDELLPERMDNSDSGIMRQDPEPVKEMTNIDPDVVLTDSDPDIGPPESDSDNDFADAVLYSEPPEDDRDTELPTDEPFIAPAEDDPDSGPPEDDRERKPPEDEPYIAPTNDGHDNRHPEDEPNITAPECGYDDILVDQGSQLREDPSSIIVDHSPDMVQLKPEALLEDEPGPSFVNEEGGDQVAEIVDEHVIQEPRMQPDLPDEMAFFKPELEPEEITFTDQPLEIERQDKESDDSPHEPLSEPIDSVALPDQNPVEPVQPYRYQSEDFFLGDPVFAVPDKQEEGSSTDLTSPEHSSFTENPEAEIIELQNELVNPDPLIESPREQIARDSISEILPDILHENKPSKLIHENDFTDDMPDQDLDQHQDSEALSNAPQDGTRIPVETGEGEELIEPLDKGDLNIDEKVNDGEKLEVSDIVLPPDPDNELREIGNPKILAQYWKLQEGPNDCALFAQGCILEASGVPFDFDLFVKQGMQDSSYDPNKGTTASEVGNILEKNGLETDRYQGASIQDLALEVGNQKGVIVAVDCEPLWGVQDGHALWVTGIEVDSDGKPINIIANDTGKEDGQAIKYPYQDFMDAWSGFGNLMVVTKDPLIK